MDWISVEDSLPEFTERVLVVTEFTDPEIVLYIRYKRDSLHGKFQHMGKDVTDKVTHWFPIPVSPFK